MDNQAITNQPKELTDFDGGWIETYTGKCIDLLHPTTDDIDIRDIAHSLSLQCRYNGHCKTFYSVAEHSVRVSWILPNHLKMKGLLHDAQEAYLQDLPRPVKWFVPKYKELEAIFERVVWARYGITHDHNEEIKYADNVILMTEARELMVSKGQTWGLDEYKPLLRHIHPMASYAAETAFLHFFKEYSEGRYEG